jgi:hypothetical protein
MPLFFCQAQRAKTGKNMNPPQKNERKNSAGNAGQFFGRNQFYFTFKGVAQKLRASEETGRHLSGQAA